MLKHNGYPGGRHGRSQVNEYVDPFVVAQLVEVWLDQHVEGQSHRLGACWVVSIENWPPSQFTASLELLASRLDEDVGGGDDSVDLLFQIRLNSASSNRVHVFTRPPCTVN